MKSGTVRKQILFVSLGLLLFAVLFSVFILCLLPPISRDALVHHLALPKIYLANHSFAELPCMIYSYFPMNLDLLYGLSLYLGSDIVPKFIHWGFGLLTSLLIYVKINSRLGPVYGMAGSLFFLTIPVVIRLSISVYVDLGLMFFSTAALFSILKWANSGFRPRHIIAAGVWCGLAMGTKYNGFISFILFIPAIVFLGSRVTRPATLKPILISLTLFVVVSCTLYAPWGIRNLIWTGNPVYPLYDKSIGRPYKTSCINELYPEARSSDLTPLQYRRLIHGEDWLSILFIPARLFFQGKDNNSRYFDGKLSPLLFFMPLCLFAFGGARKKDNQEDLVLFMFSWLYIAIALMASVARARYVGPAVPPMVVLSIYGLDQSIQFSKNYNQRQILKKSLRFLFLPGVVVFHLFFFTNYLVEQYQRYTPYQYISGRIPRTDYIKKFRPENHCMAMINSQLKKSDKVMFIFMGQRGYYCDREYIPDKGGNLRLLYAAAKEASCPKKKITQQILGSGVTHFLMNNKLTREALARDLDAQEQKRFLQFISVKTDKLCDSHGYSLYRLNLEG